MRAALLLLLACDPTPATDKAPPGDSATDDSATDDSATDDSATDAVRGTLDGSITWSVDFDADAEATGVTDCTYTRTYDGSEDTSLPWLCPTCSLLCVADVAIIDGQDCYDSVSTSTPSPTEWVGYADGLWYRASTSSLTERGPATLDGDTLTVSQVSEPTSAAGGTVSYTLSGTFTLGEEPGAADHGVAPSATYTCGWPQADPPPYTGDYSLSVGAELPDGLFPDVCGDMVRLHDLTETFLVVDVSAMDCGPCRSAAEDEESFVAAMAEEGIDVVVVTLLAPSLSLTSGTPTTAELQDWIDTYDLHGPVLGDRLWGLSVVGTATGDDFGYPAFVVVDPDRTVLDIHVGYSSFDDMAATIRGAR